MAKKNKTQVKKELSEINYWKWQFLRRNENYIRDCEKWRGVLRSKWSTKEIILGSTYSGNVDSFRSPELFFGSKDARKYWDKNNADWQSLTDPKGLINDLERKGLTPYKSARIGSWREYAEKWLIRFPLNPMFPFCPTFVEIAPNEMISEVECISVPEKVFVNDIFLSKGTSSFLKINWSAPSTYLLSHFQKKVKEKQLYLMMQGTFPKDVRTRFTDFAAYIKIWDLHTEGVPLKKIAERAYPGLTKSSSVISGNLKTAKSLINEGYKTIG